MELINGSHRAPAYFEWWYFHFVTPAGPAINAVVHETGIFGLDDNPYLSLSLLLPGQKPRYFRRALREGEIYPRRSHLRVEDGTIEETPEAIRLSLSFPDGLRFDADIVRQAPPLVIADGILYQDALTGRKSYWVAQVPHATFEGILQVDGKTRRLAGMAYQDHQWGDILIQEFVSDWVWGHYSSPERAMVFFQILTQQGHRIDRVAMVTENGLYVGTRLETTLLDELFNHQDLQKFTSDTFVSFFERQAQISFSVMPKARMRQRLNGVHNNSRVDYTRWHSVARCNFCNAMQSMYGITEYLRVRLKSGERIRHQQYR